MKKIRILALVTVVSLALSVMTGCSEKSLELEYDEDSYDSSKANLLGDVTIATMEEAEEHIKNNWLTSSPKIKDGTLSGLFDEDIEFKVDKSDEKNVKYEYDYEDIFGLENDMDKALVATISTSGDDVKVVLVDSTGNSESFDFELWLFTDYAWNKLDSSKLLDCDFDLIKSEHMSIEFEFEVV